MTKFYHWLKNGKDYGCVTYRLRGGGCVQRKFKPCWALLQYKGMRPWVKTAKGMGAYSVRVDYCLGGVRQTVFNADVWNVAWTDGEIEGRR